MKVYFVHSCTHLLSFPNCRLEKICTTEQIAKQWIEKHKDESEHQFKMEHYIDNPDNYYFRIEEKDVIEQIE
jgi:RNA binding exosome subunit